MPSTWNTRLMMHNIIISRKLEQICRVMPLLCVVLSAPVCSSLSYADSMPPARPIYQQLRDNEEAMDMTVEKYLFLAEQLGHTAEDDRATRTMVLLFEHLAERAGYPGRGVAHFAIALSIKSATIEEVRTELAELSEAVDSGSPVPGRTVRALSRLIAELSDPEIAATLSVLLSPDAHHLSDKWRSDTARNISLPQRTLDVLAGVWTGFDRAEIERVLVAELEQIAIADLIGRGLPPDPFFLYLDGERDRADSMFNEWVLNSSGADRRPAGGIRGIFDGHLGRDGPYRIAELVAEMVLGITGSVWREQGDEAEHVYFRENLRASMFGLISVRGNQALHETMSTSSEAIDIFLYDTPPLYFDVGELLEPAFAEHNPSLDEDATAMSLRRRAALLRQELSERAREAQRSLKQP